jgi:molecular chaperone DnaK (HSP70)
LLSRQPTAEIDLDSLSPGQDFLLTISRPCFESICHDLFEKIVASLVDFETKTRQRRPLLDINHSMFVDISFLFASNVVVILAGGSCNIPKLKHMIAEKFPKLGIILYFDLSFCRAYA